MDALLFVVIMVAGLGVAALVIGRAQRSPAPDDPTRPQPEDAPAASDPRDRPAGPGAEVDAPRPSREVGDASKPSPGHDDDAARGDTP